MNKAALLLMSLLALAACGAFTATDEDQEETFWNKFYGRKTDEEAAAAKAATPPDCDFYGNCKSSQKSLGW